MSTAAFSYAETDTLCCNGRKPPNGLFRCTSDLVSFNQTSKATRYSYHCLTQHRILVEERTTHARYE